MPEIVSIKICAKCKSAKPVTTFYRSKSKSDGLHCYCIDCHHKWSKWYRGTEKGRIADRKKVRKWNQANKQKHAVQQAFSRALRSGRVRPRPERCDKCSKPCKPEAHHYKGYEKEFRLDIQWLCRDCHAAVTPVRKSYTS